ncbi:MAG: exodeoxyribonuclease V subunit alpha [Deltaproteobacteria bacterium]|nr:exodeoxyribonuclease V subunit alpha [Deltaproteobacteria bacterium]
MRARGELSELDFHFARAVERWSGGAPGAVLAAAWLSRATAQGSVCLDLASAAEELKELGIARLSVPEWIDALRASAAVGGRGEFAPLILSGARLYLQRYWSYERRVADFVRERAAAVLELDEASARASLERLFPRRADGDRDEVDEQKLAAAVAASKRLCILSGGPGTGKTTTVSRILALLLEREGPLRIALAASTGKAAARLQESIRGQRARLELPAELASRVPEEASTVHRLLGAVPGTTSFRHGAENPLPYDLVVVDEVSMIDLPLMARLVSALAPRTRVLLVGDRDQLASVQAGSVLGDLCGPGPERHAYSPAFAQTLARMTGERVPGDPGRPPGGPLADCVTFLRRSYRFGAESGIGGLCLAVNQGDAAGATKLLRKAGGGPPGSRPELSWREAPTQERLRRELEELVLGTFAPGLRETDPGEAFRSFDAFRILCAHREGPYGATAVNRAVEGILLEHGLASRGGWYPGRPVLVVRNDPGLRLANGDVGLVLADPEEGGALRAYFPAPEGTAGWRRLPLLRLPPHETCYAMTVHKSQGSEFDRVLLLLGDRPSRVLTRELLYTGASRARNSLEVWGSEEVVAQAVARRVARASGLGEALWGSAES